MLCCPDPTILTKMQLTSGALGPDALSLLTDISRHKQSITHDHQSLSFLLQRVSMQHDNAASVLGTTSSMHFIYSACIVYFRLLCVVCIT